MVFASLTFLLYFLPISIILYYLWDNKTYRNVLLTVCSLFFYAWGEPIWVSLLVLSASVDYFNGLLIEKHRGTGLEKLGVISSLVINLGVLTLFKYDTFILENFYGLLGEVYEPPEQKAGVIAGLPIGISFYTFQTISYTIDVYRGEVKAQKSYLKFLMFVSLFHQLVAGPIVRYAHIAEEIEHRKHQLYDINQGILRFCIGLFKKVYIADVAGEIANGYMKVSYAELADLSGGEAWFAITMFSLQIYFDFSGYSDMAIGLGRMFGFHYLENFNYPYIAKSATDFWRRWHISLGTFFRDYVYIPLGGKKKNQYLNLFIVWFLTGLWHGASWNYVFWGLYFGVLILLERLFLKKFFEKIPSFFSHFYLIIAAILGWALFYFEDADKLFLFFSLLFGGAESWWSPFLTSKILEYSIWLVTAILLCLPIYPMFANWYENKIRLGYPLMYSITLGFIQVILLLLSVAMLAGDTYNAFIYFRF